MLAELQRRDNAEGSIFRISVFFFYVRGVFSHDKVVSVACYTVSPIMPGTVSKRVTSALMTLESFLNLFNLRETQILRRIHVIPVTYSKRLSEIMRFLIYFKLIIYHSCRDDILIISQTTKILGLCIIP